MMIQDYSDLFHYGTIAMTISTTSLGVGIGEGIACPLQSKQSTFNQVQKMIFLAALSLVWH